MSQADQPNFRLDTPFRTMLDTLPVLLWASDIDKGCYFFNTSWLRFTGRTPEQEYGDGWTAGLHPDDLQRCLDIYTKSFETQKAFSLRYRLRRHDGLYRLMVDNAVPRYTEAGAFAGFIGTCVDIEEIMEPEQVKYDAAQSEALQKEQSLNEELAAANEELGAANEEMAATNEELSAVNEELQQSQENLFQLNAELEERIVLRTAQMFESRKLAERERDAVTDMFMQAPAGICVLGGPDLIYELVNPVYQQILRGRDLLNRPLFEALPELIGTPLQQTLFDVYHKGEKYEVNELRIPLSEYEGGPTIDRFFSFSYLPRLNGNGEVDGIITFVFEVTDMVSSRKKIEESENNLRSLVMTSQYALMILKGRDWHIEIANQQIGNFWQKPLDEIVGRKLLDVLPELEGQPFPKLLEEVYDTGVRFGLAEDVFYLDTPEGPVPKYVSFYYDPLLDVDGNVSGIIVASQDITEQVKAKQLLEQSYEAVNNLNKELTQTQQNLRNLAAIVDSSTEFAGMYQTDLQVAYINPEGLKKLGWDHFEGRHIIDCVYPDDRAFALEIFPELIATGSIHYEIRFWNERTKEPFWVQWNSIAIRDADSQEVTALAMVCPDITERKWHHNELQNINEELATTNEELIETQESLRQIIGELASSESRFRLLIREAPIAIAVLNGREMLIESANEMILKIWGKTADVLGERLDVALPELQGQPFLQILDDVFTTGQPHYGNSTRALLEKDGELRNMYFNFVYQPLRNNKGKTTDILVVAADVTETVNARLKVERAEESLRMAIDAAGLGSFFINTEKRTFEISDRLREFFGYGPEEQLTYQAAIDQIHPDYKDLVAAAIEEAIRENTKFDMEYPVIGFHDGKTRWVRGIGTLQTEANGTNQFFTGVMHEITEKKLDEIRKNDFIAMVSHELKTPLTSLTLILQILDLKLQNHEDEFVAEAVGKSQTQVKRMNNLINGFLNISRLESAKILIAKQRFDIVSLIKEIISETTLTTTIHSLKFEANLPVMVNADRDKIGSVISNLLSNAIKYSPKGKEITVSCKVEGAQVTISVQDNGIGIKPQDIAKIFDRYHRVETKHTQFISGFGIGLYLSAEIINRHEGSIWVESKLGSGSTFFFKLPVG